MVLCEQLHVGEKFKAAKVVEIRPPAVQKECPMTWKASKEDGPAAGEGYGAGAVGLGERMGGCSDSGNVRGAGTIGRAGR